MRPPHPWLARLAAVCLTVSALYVVLAVADVLHLKHLLNPAATGWQVLFEWDQFAHAPTAAERVRVARGQATDRLAHLMLPAAGVTAATALRRAATGRLRLTAVGAGGRLAAAVGLVAAVACGGLETANWVHLHSEPNALFPTGWVTARVKDELEFERPVGYLGTLAGSPRYAGYGVDLPADRYPIRRRALIAHAELSWLLSGLLPPCLLACVCGLVRCSTPAGDET